MIDTVIKWMRPYWFRGKFRALNSVVPKTGYRKALIHGCEMSLDLSDYIQRCMYLGCYEPQESREIARWLKPGMTYVDVGANIGYFTLLAANRVGPGGKVLAIEPSPTLFDSLRLLIEQNPRPQVTLLNAGLGRSTSTIDLYIPPHSKGNNSPSMVPTPGWTPVSVPVLKLDDVAKDYQLQQIDMLKLDVEGYECEVLAGGSSLLGSGRVKSILCEFNDGWLREMGLSSGYLWEELVKYGFVWAKNPGQVPPLPSGGVVTYFLEHKASRS